MVKLAAKTYGDALFELALDKQQMNEFLEEVIGISKILSEYMELTTLMNHPKITKQDKLALMEKIFKGRISKDMMGFLVIVLSKGRYNELFPIFDYFIYKVKEYKSIGIARVSTAVELSSVQKSQVIKRLLETTQYQKFEMYYDVDPSLIGGMIIRIKDRVIDSSIKTKLLNLTQNLTQIQLA